MTCEIFSETPLESSVFLAKKQNIKGLYFKLDNLLHGHSFKIRGLGFCIRKARKKQPNLKTIVSSSGGNAGIAATLVAKQLGLPINVFVPSSTPLKTRNYLQSHGCTVIVHGDVWDEAHSEAQKYLNSLPDGEGFLVHPFEHEDIWEGHSSIISEINSAIGLPNVIVCSVGGGGLLCGILTGLLKLNPLQKPLVIAVETEGAASFNASVLSDKLVTIKEISSIAKSLGAKQVSEGTLRLREMYGKDKVRSVVVSDWQALDGVIKFKENYGYMVEPACGASLCLAYDENLFHHLVPELNPQSVVVFEVCGGFQVDDELISSWKNKLSYPYYLLIKKKIPRCYSSFDVS